MEQFQKVYSELKRLNMSYEIIEHPPALTSEEADAYIEGKEGVRTKTLFLCNRKKTNFFLIVIDDTKRLDMKKLGELIEEKGMQFASEEKLMEKMGIKSGSVSIFGLLNNRSKDIRVYIDKDIFSEKTMTFHPNDNTKTLFILTEDVCRFITEVGYNYTVINL
nr:prolyl-tRNA synthetase associated domain-containing protein [uncultured Aminipila sp.]